MEERVRRVESTQQMQDKIEDFQIQGYEIEEESEKHAIMVNKQYGTGGMHLVWFIFTVWWTIGLGNLAYLLYSYFSKSKRVTLRVRTTNNTNQD